MEDQESFSGSGVTMTFDPDSFNHRDETFGSQTTMVHELGHVYGNMADVLTQNAFSEEAGRDRRVHYADNSEPSREHHWWDRYTK